MIPTDRLDVEINVDDGLADHFMDRVRSARRVGFGPLLALLERVTSGGLRVGGEAAPEEEAIRFRHDPSLAFATGDVSTVRRISLPPSSMVPEREVWEITTSFLGLSGASSPLPSYLPEEVAQEDPDRPRLRAFLDLFHHRMVSLLVRAITTRDYAQSYRFDRRDPLSRRVLMLLGREPNAGDEAVDPLRALRLAPILAERSVTVGAIEAAMADALERELGPVQVGVEPFVGQWITIAEDERNRLGLGASRLGQDLLLGRRVYDRASKFRIVVGPLSREQFERARMRPEPMNAVREVLHVLLLDPLDPEVVLWVSGEAVPLFELRAKGKQRLGRDTWIGSSRRQDVRLTVELPH